MERLFQEMADAVRAPDGFSIMDEMMRNYGRHTLEKMLSENFDYLLNMSGSPEEKEAMLEPISAGLPVFHNGWFVSVCDLQYAVLTVLSLHHLVSLKEGYDQFGRHPLDRPTGVEFIRIRSN